jgi:hypothetical protein
MMPTHPIRDCNKDSQAVRLPRRPFMPANAATKRLAPHWAATTELANNNYR